MKIIIIGGDSRQSEIGARLVKEGNEVLTYAHGSDILGATPVKSLTIALADSQVVLLPLPLTRDGIYINCPNSNEKPTIDEIIENVNESSLILCGKASPSVRERLRSRHLKFRDYYESERFLRENSDITAEGAVALAMGELDVTIKGTPFMIVGGGRLAKALFFTLSALGARVTFAARSPYDLKWAAALGAKALDLASDTDELITAINQSRVIFNTVPKKVLPDWGFSSAREDLLFIELAGDESLISPTLKERGIFTICAKALPSKYAPRSAASLLYDIIKEILDERKGK